MRIILIVIGAVLSALVLAFSTMTIINVYNNSYESAPKYLVWIFIFLGLISLVVYFRKRTRANLIKCLAMLLFDIALGVVVLFAKDNPFLFSLTAGLYCVVIILSRIFDIVQNHKVRSIISNILMIAFAIALSIGLMLPFKEGDQIQKAILLECIFVSITSFIEVATVINGQLRFKVLFKVIVNTYSLEILFGLLTMIICFSLVFYVVEDSMPTFADALWYCFAVVTTVGFGDIVAVTPIGRILTVILGFYGLIVVAVITSIIVNFYNETSGKRDLKEIHEISKQEEDK